MKVLSITLILIGCVASNVFVSADGDPSTGGDAGVSSHPEPEWVKQLQELLNPCASKTFQGLIKLTINLYNAIDANDLCTATDILRSGFNLVKKLLPQITDLPYVHQAYYDILKVNFELNKQLACNKADIDDIVAFLESNDCSLTEAVCKESSNGH